MYIKINTEDTLWEELTLDKTVESYYTTYGGDLDDLCGSWSGYTHGRITYRNKENLYHRLYGPALIDKKRQVEIWYKNGVLHRTTGGPAFRHKHIQKWYVEGKLHRLDGPAIIAEGRPKEYWIGGQKLSPKNYIKEIERRKTKNHYVW